jgi:Acetyltransferase (GNAT) domain
MLWVKGELLTDIDAPGVDPTGKLENAEQSIPFNRREWFRRVETHDSEAMAPIVARAASEGCLAWLFLARHNGDVSALSNWYTLAFRPVFAGDPDEVRKSAMLTAVAKRLRTAHPRISGITLGPVPREDGTSDLLSRAFQKAGWATEVDQTSTSWTAHVAGMSFDEYWAARPGQLRSTFKRKLGKAVFEVSILTDFDDESWAAYEEVYADSWKPEEGSPKFLRDWAKSEAKAGNLRLGLCKIDGETVAAQFWTVDQGVAYIHKLAHRESVKDLSPGTILSEALFRRAIDVDHVHTIDFGTGNDGYKADWMDASAPLDTVRAFNPVTFNGLLGAARARISRLVRKPRDD